MRRPETAYSVKNPGGLAWAFAPGPTLWLTVVAAFLMAASAVHASAHDHAHDTHGRHEHDYHEHDHDEHEREHDAQCVVCSVAALNAAKLAPAEPSLFQPLDAGNAACVGMANAFFASCLSSRNARGPPLFSRTA